jgi:hypothetical protein
MPARIQPPITASNAALSTLISTRQIVTGPGIRPVKPGPALACSGRSVTHSPIATNDRAAASIAHTATARIAANG